MYVFSCAVVIARRREESRSSYARLVENPLLQNVRVEQVNHFADIEMMCAEKIHMK